MSDIVAGPSASKEDEADAEIQRLRTQLAESEAACAGYRAALESLNKSWQELKAALAKLEASE